MFYPVVVCGYVFKDFTYFFSNLSFSCCINFILQPQVLMEYTVNGVTAVVGWLPTRPPRKRLCASVVI